MSEVGRGRGHGGGEGLRWLAVGRSRPHKGNRARPPGGGRLPQPINRSKEADGQLQPTLVPHSVQTQQVSARMTLSEPRFVAGDAHVGVAGGGLDAGVVGGCIGAANIECLCPDGTPMTKDGKKLARYVRREIRLDELVIHESRHVVQKNENFDSLRGGPLGSGQLGCPRVWQ